MRTDVQSLRPPADWPEGKGIPAAGKERKESASGGAPRKDGKTTGSSGGAATNGDATSGGDGKSAQTKNPRSRLPRRLRAVAGGLRAAADRTVRVAKAAAEKADDFATDMRRARGKVTGAIGSIGCAVQRVRRGYSERDLWNLGDDEVLRLANMLEDFAYTTHGCPADYEDRRYWLKHRDDSDKELAEWMDSTALVPNSITVPADDDGKGHHKWFRSQTVAECGVMYCAWYEDLTLAAAVLKEWHAWQGGGDLFLRAAQVYGYEEAERRHDAAEARFREAWAWLGLNMGAIWD